MKMAHSRFEENGGQSSRRRNVVIGFCIIFAILLITSVINWGIISSWGKVDIERVYVSGSNGAEWSALVYRPDNATDATPAPAAIMWHGNAGNARNHESWAVEFARRGFVVVVPDLSGSGDSLYTTTANRWVEQEYWFDYMRGLSFVDKDNILTTGHSAGSTPAWDIGAMHNVKGILVAGGCSVFDGHYGAPEGSNRPAGNALQSPGGSEYMEAWYTWTGNTVICMGEAEMSNYSGSYDANRFLQENALQVLQKYPGYENAEELEANRLYGSFEENNGFLFCVEDYRIHEAAFVSKNTIGNLLKYSQEIVGDAVPNYIDSTDQIWPYKDYVGLFGIYVFAAFLFALTLLLIEFVPVFAIVRRPMARNIGMRGKGMLLATVVGILAPYLVMKTDAFGIVGGPNGANLTALGFHMRYANLGFGMILGLTIVCSFGLVVYLIHERGNKLTLSDFGMTPEGYDPAASGAKKAKAIAHMILSTFLLSLIVIGVGWAYMQLQLDVTGTDFYAWFFGVKNIPIAKIPAFLPYMVVFILCFIPLSIDMNVVRRLPGTGNETKDTIIAMIVNVAISSAVIITVIAVKWHLQSSDNWIADSSWLWHMGMDTQRIWGLPVGMGVASAGSTFLYRKTGNLWLCCLLAGMVACIMGMLYGQYQFDFLTSWVFK